MNAEVTFDGFEGHWDLSRKIVDHRAGNVGSFVGLAVFQRHADEYLYEETGLLSLSGAASMTACRRYIWRRHDARVQVLFEDRRAFHEIDLSTSAPEATHFCDPDTYDVAYDFSAWPRWSGHWQVRGPRKHYEMWSIHTRNT